MKTIILIPVIDYLKSRRYFVLKLFFPILMGLLTLIGALYFNIGNANKISEIFSEFINTQINIVAILISFSVAIITILVSADNVNTKKLKETTSSDNKYREIDNTKLSLFQVLLSNIAYNVIVEVGYIILLIAISLIQMLLPIFWLKYITALCIAFIIHILLVLLEAVSQMYLTFWSNKTE